MAFNPQISPRGDLHLFQGMSSIADGIGRLSEDLKKQKEEIKKREEERKYSIGILKAMDPEGSKTADFASMDLPTLKAASEEMINRSSNQLRQAQIKQYEAATAQMGGQNRNEAAFVQMVSELARQGGGLPAQQQSAPPAPPPMLRRNDYQEPQRQAPQAPTLNDLLGEAARRGIPVDANKREQLKAFAQGQQENQIRFEDDPKTGTRYAIFGNTVLTVPKSKESMVSFQVGPKKYTMVGSKLFDAETGEVVSTGANLLDVIAKLSGAPVPPEVAEAIKNTMPSDGQPEAATAPQTIF